MYASDLHYNTINMSYIDKHRIISEIYSMYKLVYMNDLFPGKVLIPLSICRAMETSGN